LAITAQGINQTQPLCAQSQALSTGHSICLCRFSRTQSCSTRCVRWVTISKAMVNCGKRHFR
jgi:hypothetical protein